MTGGTNCTIEQFPYLVALELYSQQICSGAIISPYAIITAAHCLKFDQDPSQYRVRAGSSLRQQGGSVHGVWNFTKHGDYKTVNNVQLNDLALLWLSDPIEFDNRTTRSISLFDSGEISENGTIAFAAGWGWWKIGVLPSQLQSIESKIIDTNTCDDIFYNGRYNLKAKGLICALNLERHQSTCRGDSGGPQVINGRVAGIISFGDTGCKGWPLPNVFTEVAYFREWIDKEVLELSEAFEREKIEARELFVICVASFAVFVTIVISIIALWAYYRIKRSRVLLEQSSYAQI